jgi:uncharacterized damage-inducible protein DinB
MFPAYFQRMARYNGWANALIYAAAAEMASEDFARETGAFFGSLKGTLNHVLAADRIWMHRLTGEGETYSELNIVLHDDLAALAAARIAEDARIVKWVEGLSQADFERDFQYANMAGDPFTDRLDLLLCHFFNHQTHHRGQAHALISELGHAPPSIDLIYFSRV